MNSRIVLALLAGQVASFTATARADESSGWQQTLAIYGMGAAINGTAQIGNVAVPVDVRFAF